MKARELFTWKFVFYQLLLRALRQLGPARADAVLARLARIMTFAWRPRARRLATSLRLGRAAIGAPWNARALAPGLAAGCARFLARDYLLETHDDAQALALFDVQGGESLDQAMAQGRGVVLVGSHFGAHLAGFHWLYRRQVPVRFMVQRPKHVSSMLASYFDRDEPEPQSNFFLSRSLDPTACVSRVLRARTALRSGKAVYLPGDVPWAGANTRPGRILGQTHPLLSIWADLASLTGAPVFFMFCTHAEGGRFSLTLEPAGPIRAGSEEAAVARYLERLERNIRDHPCDAVAHLLWPSYGLAAGPKKARAVRSRPSRRAVAARPA